MDSRLLRIWLSNKSAITPVRQMLIEEHFGSLEAIYAAKAEDYKQVNDIQKAAVAALCDKSLETAEKIVSDCDRFGIRILTFEDDEFPKELANISSPVKILYVRGTIPDWDSLFGIAVVGTRECSEYGMTVSSRISSELTMAGVTIVNGMAEGIDSHALKASLRVGGSPIAVMGCGLESAYPPKNADLMDEIIEKGCALSEYPPFSPPHRYHFPERNRIVCGLSAGVLAVEAPIRSGTLISARIARESGKPVFAVPGNILNRNSKGTNELLKSGANAVTCTKDILDAFPIRASRLVPLSENTKQRKTPAPEVHEQLPDDSKLKDLPEEQRAVAEVLINGDMHIEEIAARCRMTIAQLNAILPMLEIGGVVQKLAGSRYRFVTEN